MNKKLFITIGVVLVIVGGFAFVVMRRTNLEKQLGRPASFREFLGLGDKNPANGTSGAGILGSLFTNPDTDSGGNNGSGGTLSNVFRPLVSLFTSAPTTVDTTAPDQMSNPWFETPRQNTNTTNQPPVCSDVDLNIPFTAAEQAELDALNTRFQSLYQRLYDDTNVSDEQSTYDAVNLELQKVKELRVYCEDVAYKKDSAGNFILGGYYSRRVATPFWNGGAADSIGFLSTGIPSGIQSYNVNGAYANYNTVENNFKLHIW